MPSPVDNSVVARRVGRVHARGGSISVHPISAFWKLQVSVSALPAESRDLMGRGPGYLRSLPAEEAVQDAFGLST